MKTTWLRVGAARVATLTFLMLLGTAPLVGLAVLFLEPSAYVTLAGAIGWFMAVLYLASVVVDYRARHTACTASVPLDRSF